jgi:RNA polymerase sigma-70 factor (ECF subfamily)
MTTRPNPTAPDPHALSVLYDEYGGAAYALAYRILGERGLAEEVVQETFLTIWRQRAVYDAQRGTTRTWLLTIVHHRSIDLIRSTRARTRRDTAIDNALPLVSPEDTWATVAQGLERERVHRALATLPPEQRAVVELSFYGGFTHTQIAARIGVPLGTVKGRMRLALEKLRDTLRIPGTHDVTVEQVG